MRACDASLCLSLLLVATVARKYSTGFVTPLTKSISRSVAFVNHPVVFSETAGDADAISEEADRPVDQDVVEDKEEGNLAQERHTLFVGNVPFEKTDEDLEALFAEYGKVEVLTIPTDKETGKPRGFAFVDMSSAEEMQQAIDALDGSEFGERRLRVQASLSKEDAQKRPPKRADEGQKIYVGNLPFEATQEDISELFSAYGEVEEVFIPRSKFTGEPRGFAFVTMRDEQNVETAIGETNGADFMSRRLVVSKPLPPGEKPKRAGKTAGQKLYIGNLSFETVPDTLREMFEEFGTVHDCYMPQDADTGNSRGFGFITMDADAAQAAIDEMDGCEVDGRIIRVNEAQPPGKFKRSNRNDDGGFGGDDYDE